MYFEELIQYTKNYKAAANWIMGEIKSYLNEWGVEISSFPIKPLQIAKLIHIIEEGKISNSAATQKVFPELLKKPNEEPISIAEELNVIQESDEHSMVVYIQSVISNNPSEVERYKNGEKQLIGFFMGQLMKVSNGKADPKSGNALLRKILEE
jgi:aspartyl-tRNA(Asn)/glutamyl-tRNA(Gln) amidotransferase subunit B